MATKRDFEAIAKTIAISKISGIARYTIAHELAVVLKQKNPSFNTFKFLLACDVGEEKRSNQHAS